MRIKIATTYIKFYAAMLRAIAVKEGLVNALLLFNSTSLIKIYPGSMLKMLRLLFRYSCPMNGFGGHVGELTRIIFL